MSELRMVNGRMAALIGRDMLARPAVVSVMPRPETVAVTDVNQAIPRLSAFGEEYTLPITPVSSSIAAHQLVRQRMCLKATSALTHP